MKRHLKFIAIGLGIGLLMGIVLTMLSNALDIDKKTFQIAVYLLCVVIVLGTIIVNLLYTRPFRKRVCGQSALLEAGKPAEALADMKQMLEDPRVQKMKYMKRLCRLNMTAAYCDLHQYDQAMEIFRELSTEKLCGREELVYHLNLCICYFYQGQEEEGLLYYHLSQKLFDAYRQNKFYGGNVAVVTMWAMMAQGETAQAEELLEKAKKKWDKPSLQEDYQRVEERLALAAAETTTPELERKST